MALEYVQGLVDLLLMGICVDSLTEAVCLLLFKAPTEYFRKFEPCLHSEWNFHFQT